MSKQLTEKQVLKKLGIEDFRHLSKDSVMSFASMLDQMDPEVAKKALEQFPDFSNAVLGTMKEYKSTVDKTMEEGSRSNDQSIAAYNTVMEALRASLEDGEITFDERVQILDKMSEIADKISYKDKEHKQFLIRTLTVMGVVAIAGVGVMAAALGGNAKFGEIADGLADKALK